MASVFKAGNRWRVQWGSREHRRSRDFADKREAFKFRGDIEAGTLIVESEKQTASPTFEEFSQIYMRDYCRVHKAESQWRTDALNIRLHIEPYFAQLRLSEFRKAHLIGLKAELSRKMSGRGKPLSAKSINLILALAKRMMAIAVEMDYLKVNPFHGVNLLKQPKQEFNYWTPEERDTFLEAITPLDPVFAKIVTVACHTGLRLGELAGLQKGDVDLTRKMVRVVRSLDINTGKVGPTKNRDIGDVPLNEAALRALEHVRFLQADQLVFETQYLWSARKRLDTLASRVGLRSIRFHDLRHTFASCLAMAGVDLMLIQRLCRHKSYAMTLRYAHLHPSHLKGATEVLCTKSAPFSEAVGKSGGPRGT